MTEKKRLTPEERQVIRLAHTSYLPNKTPLLDPHTEKLLDSERVGWDEVERLLATLEEAQQQKVELWECEDCGFGFDAIHENDTPEGGYSCPLCAEARLEKELTEAQQTIARQSAALGWYELGKPELARAALGEGAKEEAISFPNCPTCNGNRTIAHPSKAGTWLCVPCDKVFEDGEQP